MSHCQRRADKGPSCWRQLGGHCDCECAACAAARMTGAFSILSYVDTSKLNDADRAELEGLQVEIDACVAKIHAIQVPWIPSEGSEP